MIHGSDVNKKLFRRLLKSEKKEKLNELSGWQRRWQRLKNKCSDSGYVLDLFNCPHNVILSLLSKSFFLIKKSCCIYKTPISVLNHREKQTNKHLYNLQLTYLH